MRETRLYGSERFIEICERIKHNKLQPIKKRGLKADFDKYKCDTLNYKEKERKEESFLSKLKTFLDLKSKKKQIKFKLANKEIAYWKFFIYI